ncbi:MAG: hypothetical protein ACK2UK_13315 [Candidatus Promineifilaceae bacterium]
MKSTKEAQFAGLVGMGAATLFFISLIIEYHYGLFPPAKGPLADANQIGFIIAMCGLLFLLLQMRRERVGGDSLWARLSQTLFPAGWAAIIVGSVINLITASDNSPLLAIGGLTAMLFSLLSGIAIARAGRWSGWGRFAPLLLGITYALLVVRVFAGLGEPTFLTETWFMVCWFLVGLAQFVAGRTVVSAQAV